MIPEAHAQARHAQAGIPCGNLVAGGLQRADVAAPVVRVAAVVAEDRPGVDAELGHDEDSYG